MRRINLQFAIISLLIFQLAVGIALYEIYLSIFVDQIVSEIKSQKSEALLRGDSLEIVKEINSLIGHDYIRCAEIVSQGQKFFAYEKNVPCKLFFLSTSRIFENSSGDVTVHLDFKMPFIMQINFLIFIVVEILMIIAGSLFFKKVKDREFKEISRFNYIAAKAAHDIRSPLSALSAISSSLPEEYSSQKNLIANIVGRITVISKDLYQMSKEQVLEVKELPIKIQEVSKNSIIRSQVDLVLELRNSISEVETLPNKNEIQIGLQSNKESVFLNIDVHGFRRVISNLFNNAIEARNEGPLKINVQIIASDERVVVTIHDNGRGIPPDILRKIGKTRVSHGKNGLSEAGSGLGLFSANEYMNLENGSLMVNSRLNMGTIVSLDFRVKGRL
jgi:signal transduction histidine kinase